MIPPEQAQLSGEPRPDEEQIITAFWPAWLEANRARLAANTS